MKRFVLTIIIITILMQVMYGHENEMYNVGVNLKEVECL